MIITRDPLRTVGNFRIAGGHVIFVVENGFSCLDVIIYHEGSHRLAKQTIFLKKIFRENHLWGTSAAFFEKIVLLENIFYHTSSDAVLPADFEYHLSFALRCYFKGKNRDFGGKKQGFWKPRTQSTWQMLLAALLSTISYMDEYSLEI